MAKKVTTKEQALLIAYKAELIAAEDITMRQAAALLTRYRKKWAKIQNAN